MRLFSSGTMLMSRVYREWSEKVRIPRSHRMTFRFPSASRYSAASRNSSRVADRKVSTCASVSYVRQKAPLGLGHAVLAARDLVGNEPFAVMLPDDLIDAPGPPALRQMLDVFERGGDPVIALLKVAIEDISAYGVIRGERDAKDARVHVLKELVEKPKKEDAPSDLAIIGRYILTPDIFDDLVATARDGSGEIQLTNGLRALVARRRLLGYEFEGTRYDAGQKLGFLKATVDLALKRSDLGPALREHLKSLGLV